MRVVLSLFLLFGCFPSFGYVHAQRNTTYKANAVRLIKVKPSVYITFERKGKREPLETGESKEGIWLRLHNNTQWEISFCAFGVPAAYGEVGMYYELEEIPFEKSGGETCASMERKTAAKREPSEPPIGYRRVHACSVVKLSPGKTIVFSVPREHLAENLAVKVAFNYGWEESEDIISGLEPQHSVYFYATSLLSEK